jgi:hypothetical protein
MSPPAIPTVVYVHGAGNKPPASDVKRAWDLDLFGHDLGQRTRMAYYADLLHATPSAIGPDACTQEQALATLVVAVGVAEAVSRPPTVEESPGGHPAAAGLAAPPAVATAAAAAVSYADAYFFTDQRQPIRERLRQA